MGSPVSALMANLTMEYVERKILAEFPAVVYWKRFVDDTWVVLPQSDVSRFHTYINSIEPSIKFTMEEEEDRKISFLDVEIDRSTDESVSFGVYRKATHTGRYLNFDSQHPSSH